MPCRPDAGPLALDAGRDGGSDAGVDAAAAPTCDDASPCWERMSGLPAGCEIERARHPERIHVTDFATCGDGCLRGSLGLTWIPSEAHAWSSGGSHYVGLVGYPQGASLQHLAFVRTDGRVADALRQPQDVVGDGISCGVLGVGVGEAMVGFAIDYVTFETPDRVRDARSFVYRAPLGGLVDATLVHTVEMPDVGAGRRIERLAVSSRAVLWEIHGGGHLQAVVDGTFADVGWAAFHSRVFGDHLLYEEQAATVRIMHWTPESGLEVYLDLRPALTAWFVSDGADIAWVQLPDLATTYGELWTAPLVRDPTALAPRRVLENVASSGLRIGDGLIAYEEVDSGRVVAHRVVDLATGEVRRWAPPPGEVNADLLLVSEAELVFVTASAAELSQFLYRIDPRTLPVVPP